MYNKPFKKGELLDLVIEDLKKPTMKTNLDIITHLLKDALEEKQNKVFDLFCTFKDRILSLEVQCTRDNVNKTMIITNDLVEVIPEKLKTSLVDTCVTIMNLLKQIKLN